MFRRLSSTSVQLIGFLALGVLTSAALFAFNLVANLQVQNALEEISQRDVRLLDRVTEVRYHFAFARKEEKNWILFKSPHYLASRKKSLARVGAILEELKDSSKEVEELLESIGSHVGNYAAMGDELEKIDSVRGATRFTAKAKKIDEDFSDLIRQTSDFLLREIDRQQIEAVNSFRRNNRNSTIVAALGLGLFIGTGLLWIRRFRRRLKRLLHATQKMTDGDYSPKLEDPSEDELGILAHYFNEMAQGIETRENKISEITMELIQANNLLKKKT